MKNSELPRRLEEALAYVRSRTDFAARQAVILGSGLGSFGEAIQAVAKIPTSEIPHYPSSTVPGHAGELIFGYIERVPVIAVKGRVHYYEGYSWEQVTFSVRLLRRLGVSVLLLTNAAGSMNPNIRPGDLMLIEDHINLFFTNPLIGIPVEDEQQRFVDMLHVYDPDLQKLAENTAQQLGISLKRGVLAGSTGPTYETRAEVAMIRRLGGDAGTMSTIPEAIVARQEGLRVLGISCITNMATGLATRKLDHQEVTEVAALVEDTFQRLVRTILEEVEKQGLANQERESCSGL